MSDSLHNQIWYAGPLATHIVFSVKGLLIFFFRNDVDHYAFVIPIVKALLGRRRLMLAILTEDFRFIIVRLT